jgi:type VI secretion system secreted protein VgrG
MDGNAIELATLGDFRTRAGYYDRQAQAQNKPEIPALSEITVDPSQEEITESYILLEDSENPIESYRYRLADCKSEFFSSAGTSEFISGEDKNITFWLSVDRAERS